MSKKKVKKVQELNSIVVLGAKEHNLKDIAAGNSMTLDDWAQRGENSVVYKLARAQEKVDKILLEEWKPVAKSLGDLHQGKSFVKPRGLSVEEISRQATI